MVCLCYLVGQCLHLQYVHVQTSPYHLVVCCHLGAADLVEEFTEITCHQNSVLEQVETEAGVWAVVLAWACHWMMPQILLYPGWSVEVESSLEEALVMVMELEYS